MKIHSIRILALGTGTAVGLVMLALSELWAKVGDGVKG
jgi:hypothetical protein